MRQTFSEAALTKEDVIDIINIGIETLVRHRYELPAFDTLLEKHASSGLQQIRHCIRKFTMHLEMLVGCFWTSSSSLAMISVE